MELECYKDNNIKEHSTILHDNLSEQLVELELLKSMYPNEEDIVFPEPEVLCEIRKYLEEKNNTYKSYCLKQIDFTLYLKLEFIKLEVSINMPQFYPTLEKVKVNVRCNQLNRKQETDFNKKLSDFVKEYPLGEVILYSVINWIQDNIHDYSSVNDTSTELRTNDNKDCEKDHNFARYWIYSHHIYNKKKRVEIQKQAKDFDLTGFCMPGKPGLICVEGNELNCQNWWKIIKSMTWQKIILKKSEIFSKEKKLSEQKFNSFSEMHFSNASSRQGKHSDMSELAKYLEKCGLSYVFNEIFGLSSPGLEV